MKKIILPFLVAISQISTPLICTADDVPRSVSVITKSHLGAGFFAEFRKVVENLIYYQQDGISEFYVDWTDQFFPYKDGIDDNGWDYYFNPIKIYPGDYGEAEGAVFNSYQGGPFHELHDQTCVAPWLRYEEYKPLRKYVNAIINKHIEIKPQIKKEVEQYYREHLQGYYCIGVHVRFAFTHQWETPGGHPSLEQYCQEVDSLIAEQSQVCKVFLASDSHAVINYFKQRYPTSLVHIDVYRAQNNEDPHLIFENAAYYTANPDIWHKKKPAYHGGLGVLLDCLLLAKCDHLIHTMSNVSTFATYFNPEIKSTYLPKGVPYSECSHTHNKNIRNPFINP